MQKDLMTMLVAVELQYLSISLFPAFWLLFVFKYLKDRAFLSMLGKAVLFIVPLVTLTLVFTNDAHHLYYLRIGIEKYQGITLFRFAKGPWYFVHSIYFYCCLILGIVLLVRKADWNNYYFSRQTKSIIGATIIPAICNFLYLSGIRPSHGIDLTPCAFTVTTIAIAYSLIRYNLFDLLPIAREKVVEALQEGVMVLDDKSRVVFLNAAVKAIISDKLPVEGSFISSVFPELAKSDDKEIEIEVEPEIRKIFSVTNSELKRGGFQKDGRVLLFKDITEQKQVEALLIQAKENAELTSKAKADFLSTMSHEIRTPMNAVIGFTQLLKQNAREDQKEYLDLIQYSGENLLALINDILDFSKIDADKVELEEADFDLKDLINKVRLTLQVKAQEKGIQLNATIDENIPGLLKGDRVRLGQIFINLVSNAVKFTEKGEVNILARVIHSADASTSIAFEVRDTGIGIPAEKQDSIFESFTQASSDTTRKFGGTGLGLAICKRLVELHGSIINLQSQPGKGSSFKFEIEFKRSAAKEIIDRAEQTSNAVSLKGLKVLLAEDNKINVVLARQLMKQWQVECDVAENGLIAVEMVKKKDYDLVLMDLQMPEADGYEATRMIRTLQERKYQSLPVIALSAAALSEEKEKVYQSGMNDFVTKPFRPEDLFEKLNLYKAHTV